VAAVSNEVNATLVVAANESLCTYVLPSRLAALRERWPKVRLEVVTGACAEIRDSVTAGKSDLGLVLEGDVGLKDGFTLAAAELLVVAAPGHALVRSGATPDDLRRCDFYMSDATGNFHQLLRQYFEAAEAPVPMTQSLGSVEGVKRGILAGGAALGVLPSHAVEQELRGGVLCVVHVRPPLPGLVLRAVLAPGGNLAAPAEELVQGLRGAQLQHCS